jgi:uncharacterized protein (TIGR03437 family)
VKLPLDFELQQGQAQGSARYIARTPGHTILLTPQGMTLATPAGGSVMMRFLNGAAQPRTSGEVKLAGVSHYLIGSDRRAWQRSVPHFARVRYSGVYAGIDAVFHGEEGSLEYDFAVSPGASPDAIRLSFENATEVRIDGNGELVIRTASGEIRQHRPVLFQEHDGIREPVAGGYRILGRNVAGFTVGTWDRRRTLVIDPVLVYSSYVGLSGKATLTGMAVDAAGNTYLAGSVTSPDLPATAGALQSAKKGAGAYRSSDKGVTWNSPNSSLGSLRVEAIAINPANPAVVYTGTANGVYKSSNSGVDWTIVPSSLPPDDFPAVTIDPTNQSVVYAGGQGLYKSEDAGATWKRINLQAGILSIAVSNKNPNLLYVGTQAFGALRSTDGGANFDFLTGSGRVNSVAIDPADSNILYLALKDAGFYKSTNGGQSFTWYQAGLVANSSDPMNANVVVVDPKTAGRLYLGTGAGLFRSTNSGANWTAIASLADRRILSIAVDPNDSNLVYAGTGSGIYKSTVGGVSFTSAGPVAADVNAIAVDSKSQFVYAGLYSGPDVFVSKIAPDGKTLVYSTYFGGSGADTAGGIVVDAAGNVTLCGTTDSSDLPTRTPIQARMGGATDIFVTRLNPTGSDIVFSTFLGGRANDVCTALVQDSAGSLYVLGTTYVPVAGAGANNYPVTTQAYQKSSPGGGQDCVVTKVDAKGAGMVYSTFLGGNNADTCLAMAVDPSGSVAITGSTRSGDFPNTGANFGDVKPSASRFNFDQAFVTKLNPAGSALLFSGYLAGAQSISQGHAIAVGPNGRIYVAGLNLAPDFPLTSGALRTPTGTGIFLSAYEPDGSALAYSAIVPALSDAFALQIDANGNAWMAVDAASSGAFATTDDAFDSRSRRGLVASGVVEVDAAAANVLYASYLAGTGAISHSAALQLATDGSLYVAGYALSSDFPMDSQTFESVEAADYALFVEKIDTVTPAAAMPPVLSAVVNAGGLGAGPSSPGGVVVIQGSNLGGKPSVAVNGVAAAVLSADFREIVAQVGYDTPLGDTTLAVTNNGTAADPVPVTIAAAAPGIYVDRNGHAIAFNADGAPNTTKNRAVAGSTITVRLTGIGPLDNPVAAGQPTPDSPPSLATLDVSATVGDQAATAGPVQLVTGMIGVGQASITLPSLAAGEYPVVITIGGAASNAATISLGGS